MDLQSLLLFPLHVAVLLVLHTVFAAVRLVRVLVLSRLSTRRHQSTLPCPATDLADKRWNKVPKHLAVVLAPSRTNHEHDLESKERTLIKLVSWCTQLGIPELSVYDRDGLLVANAERIALLDPDNPLLVRPSPQDSPIVTLVPTVSPTPPPLPPSLLFEPDQLETASSSDATGTSTLVSDGTSTPKLCSASTFTLRLVSRRAGRPQLAKLAQTLASERRRLASSGSSLSSEQVAQAIDAFPLPEPDLLFVIGGSHLRLSGFPPWQLKLSEMYHYATPPAWFPSPTTSRELDYSNSFRNALDLYGRAEMRLGR